LVRVNGQVIPVGNCAGVFLVPARQVTVQAGQQIDVRMTEQPAGSSGNHLVPVFALPRSSRPAVLADGTVSQDRASATYRAVRPGHAVLTTRAWCLAGSGEISGSCPVLDVTVVSSAQA
jgi:predicted RecA/RadA family phage recombinase